MLCLLNNTQEKWIQTAIENIDLILIDHAHCEKKAAATGLSLLSTYPDKSDIGIKMCELVEEEIGHYRAVLQILMGRNLKLNRDDGDPYVKELLSYLNKNEPERMIDRLLCAGIIEARSCERLQILGKHLPDEALRKFYWDLSTSEAGHYVTFVKLAKLYAPEDKVHERLKFLCEREAEIISSLKNEPRIHG